MPTVFDKKAPINRLPDDVDMSKFPWAALCSVAFAGLLVLGYLVALASWIFQ